MGRKFKHLTWADRIRIETMLRSGHRIQDIADMLGVNNTTVYREIKRGRYIHTSDLKEEERYSPDIAERKYRENLKAKGPELKIGSDHKLAAFIEDKMVNEDYSVGAVLGYIGQHDMHFSVTITRPTLYRYIDMGLFLNLTNKDLPVKGSRKKKKKTVRKIQSRDHAGISIEKRPEEIDTRDTFGHWEMDTVVGLQGKSRRSLLVLTERKTRMELIFLLREHTAGQVVSCIDRLEKKWGKDFGTVFKSITVDNGTEFSDCTGIQKSIYKRKKDNRTVVYYCHPYSSYERGSNENQNKLIRRKIPKGTDFDHWTGSQIRELEKWINNYPRLLFEWETSQMRFDRELAKAL